jgi:OOP family OmpA-OmpF porin
MSHPLDTAAAPCFTADNRHFRGYPMRLAVKFAATCLTAAALAAAPAAAAPNPAYLPYLSTDAPRASDDPLVTRFAGSTILTQTVSRLDELTLPAGPALGKSYSDPKWGKTVSAEGRVSRTIYVVPKGVSSLEVIRGLQAGLSAKGFKPAFECKEAACGEAFARLKYYWQDKATLVGGEGLEVDRARFVPAVFDSPKAIRYALMKRGEGAAAAYAGLYVALNEGGTNGDLSDTLTGHVTALVELVEPAPAP